MNSAKVSIVTALITAGTTILIAFIGIVPQLRKDDNVRIAGLNKTIAEFKQNETGSGETITISGTTYKDNNLNQTQDNIEVYLLPASGNELVTTADNDGKFVFKNIPSKNWWIIVRNLNTNEKTSGKFLIDPSEGNGSLNFSGAFIQYKINH
jgi:hypothetical protein